MALPRHGAAPGGRHRDLGDRLRRRRLPWLLVGLAAAAALVIGVAIAVAPGARPTGIAVEDFETDPEPSWALEAPGGAAATAVAEGSCTVAQDRALVVWDSVAGLPAAVTLLDTASGTALWSLDLPLGLREAACVAVAPSGSARCSRSDAEERRSLLALDLAEGAVAAEARDASSSPRPPGRRRRARPDAGAPRAPLRGRPRAGVGRRGGRPQLPWARPSWPSRARSTTLPTAPACPGRRGTRRSPLSRASCSPWTATARTPRSRAWTSDGQPGWRLDLPDGAAIRCPARACCCPDAGRGG